MFTRFYPPTAGSRWESIPALGPRGLAPLRGSAPEPPTVAGERPWTAEALKEWLANPRKLRPATTMPPVALTPEELQRVTEQLGVPQPSS